jgi:hypothetical protein
MAAAAARITAREFPPLPPGRQTDIWYVCTWMRACRMVQEANNWNASTSVRQFIMAFGDNAEMAAWIQSLLPPQRASLDAIFQAIRTSFWPDHWPAQVIIDISNRRAGVQSDGNGGHQWETPQAYGYALSVMNDMLPANERLDEARLTRFFRAGLPHSLRTMMVNSGPFATLQDAVDHAASLVRQVPLPAPTEAEMRALFSSAPAPAMAATVTIPVRDGHNDYSDLTSRVPLPMANVAHTPLPTLVGGVALTGAVRSTEMEGKGGAMGSAGGADSGSGQSAMLERMIDRLEHQLADERDRRSQAEGRAVAAETRFAASKRQADDGGRYGGTPSGGVTAVTEGARAVSFVVGPVIDRVHAGIVARRTARIVGGRGI